MKEYVNKHERINSSSGEAPEIFLVFPNPTSTIPTGFTYVAKRFRKNGFKVKVLINTFLDFKTNEEILKIITHENPDIVGFSYVTLNLLEVYHLQKLVNKQGFTVVAGGDHPTICPDEVLDNGADFVIRGEGELAIDDFCKWFQEGRKLEERKNIRSASFMESGRVVHNPTAPRIKDLDSLGDLEVADMDLEPFRLVDGSIKGFNVILGGRGCPFRCTFCSHSAWLQYSYRSVDSMLEDMVQRRKKYGIKTFFISDENFSVNKEKAINFCRRLIKEKVDFKWMAQTRISCVDEEILKLFKESGCEQISYGVESLDDYTLKKIRKGHTAAQAYSAVEMTGKIGVPMYVNLMTGFPWQTVEAVRKDIKFIHTMGKYISCFQLYGAVIPYFDTPIYEEYHEKEGFTEFWLRPDFQNAGMCIYQNVPNPYAVSTYWQRNLYDDTYIAEDYFFRFSKEYKRMVAYMGSVIGWHSIQAATKESWKKYIRYALGITSRLIYEISPSVEKQIVGKLVIKNVLHQKRAQGKFLKT